MVEAFPFKLQLNCSYENFPRPWNATEAEEWGCKTSYDIMSGSLHQMRILRAAFKIDIFSTNVRLLHDLRLKSDFNDRNYKTSNQIGIWRGAKKFFSRRRGSEFCWQNLSFRRCRIFLKIAPELWFVILKCRFNYVGKTLNYINIS
jgi:hypothetical protein